MQPAARGNTAVCLSVARQLELSHPVRISPEASCRTSLPVHHYGHEIRLFLEPRNLKRMTIAFFMFVETWVGLDLLTD